MTLQNLRYIIEVANCQSFSKAAQNLFLSQSTLSTAIRETEEELGIRIFVRSNRGVTLTPDGEDCIKYCKEIIERSDHLAARYRGRGSVRTVFSVSAHHLPFAVRAFQELMNAVPPEEYDVAIRETETAAVLHDVSAGKSELGIVAFRSEQLRLIARSLYIHDLEFHEVAPMDAYVFLRRDHPLSQRPSLTLEELHDYPFVTFDQEDAPSYYSEEISFFQPLARTIHVCDRATKMAVIRSSDAFSIGIDLPNFNADLYFQNRKTELAAIPYRDQAEPVLVGYLSKSGHELSATAKDYLLLLDKHIQALRPAGFR